MSALVLKGRPLVSAISLTWDSERYVRACVERTIEEFDRLGARYEFFIVDNGSKDGTRLILSELQARYRQLQTIFLSRNHGTTHPRNLALRRANGHFVCVLDSDAYPTEGCVGQLIACLSSRPEVGLVAPRILYPDGRYQKSTDVFPTILSKLGRVLFLKAMEATERPPERGPVAYATSAFWLLRREALHTMGVLDQEIFYSPEDVDYCLRLWKAGLSVWYEPGAVAIHDAQERSRRITPNRLTISHIKGLAHLWWKHRYLLRSPRFPKSVARLPHPVAHRQGWAPLRDVIARERTPSHGPPDTDEVDDQMQWRPKPLS